MSDYIVEMRHITKRFPGIVANDDVSISIRKGEVYALLGENGAGKSTLMSMLFGMYEPDHGEILINGEPVTFRSSNDATAHSIGMVHQHFKLVDNYTVAENIVLGIEPMKKKFGFLPCVDMKQANQEISELSKKYGLEVNPTDKIQDLQVSVRQRVEILKMLYRKAEIMIFDEPTAVLTPQETAELFVQLKLLRESGKTIIFISHKLNEVKELCDRVTVIRKGKTIGVYNVADVSEADISRAMVGVDVILEVEKSEAKPGDNVLVVNDLGVYNEASKRVVNGVSFSVREGEIVGIAGVEGNGQRELVDCIAGLHTYSEGSIKLLNKEIGGKEIKELRQLGLVHVPEDRMTLGIAGNMSIRDNMVADKLDDERYNKKILNDPKAIEEDTDKWIKDYLVLCKNGEQAVNNLSGGNIQKVVVAREFTSYNRLVICDQPTRGIDVGASEFIRKQLVSMRDDGKAVLLISADLGEILNLSDTLLVMYGGEITAVFHDVKSVTEEELGYYMLGVKKMSPEEIGGALHA